MNKRWLRSGRTNKHHIVPRIRGGKTKLDNLIRLDENRHAAFHLLFGTMTFIEAASLLKRAEEIIKRRIS